VRFQRKRKADLGDVEATTFATTRGGWRELLASELRKLGLEHGEMAFSGLVFLHSQLHHPVFR
jgi:hypothetical protein